MDERYDRIYQYNQVTFRLDNFMPEIDQCRFLILKVLDQAMRDYIALADSPLPNDRLTWEEAKDFIFSNDYTLQWGDNILTTEELLDYVDINIEWVRLQTKKKYKDK